MKGDGTSFHRDGVPEMENKRARGVSNRIWEDMMLIVYREDPGNDSISQGGL